MGKNKKDSKKLWGEVASDRFLRLPVELLYHYKNIGLSNEDLVIILWIDFHQWGERPAFPHPIKLADVLKVDVSYVIDLLQSLQNRGFINLEPTRKPGNYYQDIRPTRNRLRTYLKENPNHCEVIRRDFKKGIDTSSNRNSLLTDTSNSKDTSIPRAGTTTSIGQEFNKRLKKD